MKGFQFKAKYHVTGKLSQNLIPHMTLHVLWLKKRIKYPCNQVRTLFGVSVYYRCCDVRPEQQKFKIHTYFCSFFLIYSFVAQSDIVV